MSAIALDATYGIGNELTGVGVYCRELLYGVARQHPSDSFQWLIRPHRFLRSFKQSCPANASRRPLFDSLPNRVKLFHGLNQRLPAWRARRTVTTFHDLFVMTGEYSTLEFRERFTKLARDAASRSDLIICVSQFTADQVHELLGVSRDRLRVVHHGVYRPSPADIQREKIVLHVGAIQKRKNVGRLIEAFAALENEWKLILAGSTGYGGAEILEAAKDNPRVTITGYVSNRELDQLYRRASIFAFPSLDEGFGIPVLEAMAHGLPVIASQSSAIPEVCGDAAILIDPENTEQLASALRMLAAEEGLRQQYANRGLKRAEGFRWQTAVEKTWDIYRELLG